MTALDSLSREAYARNVGFRIFFVILTKTKRANSKDLFLFSVFAALGGKRRLPTAICFSECQPFFVGEHFGFRFSPLRYGLYMLLSLNRLPENSMHVGLCGKVEIFQAKCLMATSF